MKVYTDQHPNAEPGEDSIMIERQRISGIIPPVATPLTPEEDLDEPGLRRLIRKLVDAGCHGLFVLGGTGEGVYLTEAVRAQTIEVTVEEAAGRLPVIVDTSDVSVKRAVSRGQQAARLGADVLISTPPFQRPMEPPEVYDYFVALAEESGMPTMLYNVPPLTGTHVPVATIVRLAQHQGIVGMKNSAEFTHLAQVAVHTRGTGFRLLCGVELFFLPAMMMGAVGGTLGLANLWPELCVQAYEVGILGDWKRAQKTQNTLLRFAELAFRLPWVPVVKHALSLIGVCGPTVMRPARTLSETEQGLVRDWLIEYGLLD
jgi:4-hydroxy-tetrahydrodipicolinate synthase